MPQLKEILHAIVSDLTEAKNLANQTTVRRAELNKSHPLLSSLPAPRMRLTNVKIDLPFLIEAVVPGTPGSAESPRNVVDALVQLLRDGARVRQVPLSEADFATFKEAFLSNAETTTRDPQRLQGAGVREAFSRAVDLALMEVAKRSNNPALFDQLGPMRHDVKHAAAAAALKQASEPSLTIEVRTDQIKARASEGTVTHIHLELNEDSIEWLRDTEAPKRKLVPE
jgi:hypothetical protein